MFVDRGDISRWMSVDSKFRRYPAISSIQSRKKHRPHRVHHHPSTRVASKSHPSEQEREKREVHVTRSASKTDPPATIDRRRRRRRRLVVSIEIGDAPFLKILFLDRDVTLERKEGRGSRVGGC